MFVLVSVDEPDTYGSGDKHEHFVIVMSFMNIAKPYRLVGEKHRPPQMSPCFYAQQEARASSLALKVTCESRLHHVLHHHRLRQLRQRRRLSPLANPRP